ncbi:hypothetical protein ACXX82_17615 [Glaciimonas sp. GNP009]
MLLYKKRFSKDRHVLNMLASHAKKVLPSSKKILYIQIPRIFSIIECPEIVIDLVTSFAKGLRSGYKIGRIDFQLEQLEQYDLAANALLDFVAVEFKNELQQLRRKRLRIAGRYPRDQSVKRFIKAMGIIKHMEINHEAPSAAEVKKLRIFDARNCHYVKSVDGTTADFKDREQAKFVDHIDQCLRDHNKELSDEGKQSLVSYLGEILANAEDHADFVDWSVQGYLDNSLDIPVCEIAIFNFGQSIADSLRTLPNDSYTKNQIRQYVETHRSKGFFGNRWREEDLLTVIALQGHVSRLNSNKDTSRGQGTVEFINFFQKIYSAPSNGLAQAKMAIVSGGTYILFDGTYRMQDRVLEGTIAGRTIAFNSTNDLNELPDPSFVKSLGQFYFPGTIISIRFPLSLSESSLVEELQNEQSHDH